MVKLVMIKLCMRSGGGGGGGGGTLIYFLQVRTMLKGLV